MVPFADDIVINLWCHVCQQTRETISEMQNRKPLRMPATILADGGESV